MEGEQLVTLEQALAELQAKDANTQHKLDILIPIFLSPKIQSHLHNSHLSLQRPWFKTGPSVGV